MDAVFCVLLFSRLHNPFEIWALKLKQMFFVDYYYEAARGIITNRPCGEAAE